MEDLKKKKTITLYTEPDPILRQPTTKVDEITAELLETFDDMADIMTRFDGIGLAGPQIGLLKKIIIIDAETIAKEDKLPLPSKRYLKIINPKIISVSKELCKKEEGCLSVPTIYYEIERPKQISISYTDENGKNIQLDADGLLARCIEHELDHLDGKLFIDYLSSLKKRLVSNKLKKMKIGK
ncbi:MAG: peptide deformylase [Alphaproteobacteria bacterium]